MTSPERLLDVPGGRRARRERRRLVRFLRFLLAADICVLNGHTYY